MHGAGRGCRINEPSHWTRSLQLTVKIIQVTTDFFLIINLEFNQNAAVPAADALTYPCDF